MAVNPSSSSGISPERKGSSDRHKMLYKTPPSNKLNHREKCLNLLTSKRKERQAKLLETFRRLNNEKADDSKKDEIIRETVAQMFRELNAEFPDEGFDEGHEYEQYLSTLETELSNDYDMLLQQEIFEDDMLQADIDLQYSVTCFACQKNCMSFEYNGTHTRITCSACTFTFIISRFVDSQQMNDRFIDIMNEHRFNCRSIFNFVPFGDFHQCENLQILCKNCNFSVMFF